MAAGGRLRHPRSCSPWPSRPLAGPCGWPRSWPVCRSPSSRVRCARVCSWVNTSRHSRRRSRDRKWVLHPGLLLAGALWRYLLPKPSRGFPVPQELGFLKGPARGRGSGREPGRQRPGARDARARPGSTGPRRSTSTSARLPRSRAADHATDLGVQRQAGQLAPMGVRFIPLAFLLLHAPMAGSWPSHRPPCAAGARR